MLAATIIFAVLAVILLTVGYFRGEGQHITGLKAGFAILIQILPLLVLAFIVAGMVQALLPREMVASWVGAESGLKGIMIGTVAGSLTPGGPFRVPSHGGRLLPGRCWNGHNGGLHHRLVPSFCCPPSHGSGDPGLALYRYTHRLHLVHGAVGRRSRQYVLQGRLVAVS